MEATPLGAWESFYVIVGSSAAALTGLQFVVIALGAEGSNIKPQGLRAFATPTIVHFCAVLLISAILSAPWPAASDAAIALVVCGVVGTGYTLLVIRHARRQRDYVPVFEDWLFHSVLPLLAYISLSAAAATLVSHAFCLFVIAGTALLLLFIGIHNAWDAATWIALDRSQQSQSSRDGLRTVAGDEAGADAAVINANEKPRGKNNVAHSKQEPRRHGGS